MTRVAIAHDYLTQRGGAERVVLTLLRAFPDATIYTTLYDPEGTYPEFRQARIVTSPLNRIGPLRRNHRFALPLLPFAAWTLRPDADVVVASSSGWAHGFRSRGKRLVYCYSPARWLYQTDAYLGPATRFSASRLMIRALRPWLVRWDKRQAAKATQYLSISTVVRARILETYGRESELVPPSHSVDPTAPRTPVEALTDWVDPGYHLIVSRLLPYKNVDAAIRAFADLSDQRLVVVGRGPERERLLGLAGPNVRLLQDLTDAELRWVYAHARALIAPSIEDFGLTPLEAGSYGHPTLALRGGGYLDTIAEGVTGQFFEEPTPAAIRDAVLGERGTTWDADAIRDHVARFDEERFIERMRALVEAL